jgi:uncharacterized protein (TIGR02145 family)
MRHPTAQPTAGRYLKATSWWNDYYGSSGNGEDTHGFSALPGGFGYSGVDFGNVGNSGGWWSSSEYDSNYAYLLDMFYYNEDTYYYSIVKSYLYSVRCVRD